MSTSAALAVALAHSLVGQWADVVPIAPPPRAVAPRASSDLYFVETIEDFCITASLLDPSRTHALTVEDLAGPRGAALLGGLSCGRHGCREMARELIARDAATDPAGVFKVLCVGCRARDPNVRHEARLLMDRLYFSCAMCGGRGGYEEYGGWAGCGWCDPPGVYHH